MNKGDFAIEGLLLQYISDKKERNAQLLFLRPPKLLSLPSFSQLPWPNVNLKQFPGHLKYDQAGLAVDETGQTRLMVSGGIDHNEWWLWRNGLWEKTANSIEKRFGILGNFCLNLLKPGSF